MKFTPPPPILEVKRKIFFKNRGLAQILLILAPREIP